MTRFAVYARFSSDQQSDASIEDQVRLCRERVARDGGTVVATFEDRAISGSRIDTRPGMLALIAQAKAGRFDVVIAEALDRLSRDLGDTDRLFKILKHHGVRLLTLSEGEVNKMHVSFKGLMNDEFLAELGRKTRRGQEGRVLKGRVGGGLGYGYRKVLLNEAGEAEDGLRAIDEAEAEVVRRIFRDYAAGLSPREIATALNLEHVPAPRGGLWNASTINGDPKKLNGILVNRNYNGQILYGRVSYQKDPETGSRSVRITPDAKRITVEAPHLRIVDPAVWEKVQQRRTSFAGRPARLTVRPRHLLSGLVRCAVCGGAYAISNSERMACVTRHECGTCTNGHTIKVPELEARVLGALRERLLSPVVFAEYAKEYRAAMREARDEVTARRLTIERELADAAKKVDRIVEAISEGTASATLRAKLTELEQDKERLAADLRGLGPEEIVVDLHPGIEAFYKQQVANLDKALYEAPAERAEAQEVLRSLIGRVLVHPTNVRGKTRLTIESSVTAVLAFANRETGQELFAGRSGAQGRN